MSQQRLASLFIDYGMVWALLVIAVIAVSVYPGIFAFANIRNMFGQSAPVGIVAVGMTFVIIAGGLDFSVGAMFALSAVLFAKLADPLGLWGAAGIVVLACLAAGLINGFVVNKLKVSSFVATLGTGSIFGGLAYIISNSAPQSPINSSFENLGIDRWLGWPIAGWIMILTFLFGAFVLKKTPYGQSIYAIGGNKEAARLSGLRVTLIDGSTYAISALSAGLGGMILASRLGVGQADMGGTISLDAIAIVVVGGTSLLGGEGAIWRTAIGLAILAILTNVFDSLALSTSYQLVIKGVIVVAAVAFDVFARSRRS
jgi:ribose transport system permease protein